MVETSVQILSFDLGAALLHCPATILVVMLGAVPTRCHGDLRPVQTHN